MYMYIISILSVTVCEICLLAFPIFRNYWSTSWPFANDNFSSIMSSRRFELIMKFLHLNDSEAQPRRGDPAFGKLYKVRPLLDMLLENFKTSY